MGKCQRHFAIQFIWHAFVDQAGPEAAACGRIDGRTTAFRPLQQQPWTLVLRACRPGDGDQTFRYRQRAVLAGVGGQFVQGHAQRQRLLRRQVEFIALQADPRIVHARIAVIPVRCQFVVDDANQRGAEP